MFRYYFALNVKSKEKKNMNFDTYVENPPFGIIFDRGSVVNRRSVGERNLSI